MFHWIFFCIDDIEGPLIILCIHILSKLFNKNSTTNKFIKTIAMEYYSNLFYRSLVIYTKFFITMWIIFEIVD